MAPIMPFACPAPLLLPPDGPLQALLALISVPANVHPNHGHLLGSGECVNQAVEAPHITVLAILTTRCIIVVLNGDPLVHFCGGGGGGGGGAVVLYCTYCCAVCHPYPSHEMAPLCACVGGGGALLPHGRPECVALMRANEPEMLGALPPSPEPHCVEVAQGGGGGGAPSVCNSPKYISTCVHSCLSGVPPGSYKIAFNQCIRLGCGVAVNGSRKTRLQRVTIVTGVGGLRLQ